MRIFEITSNKLENSDYTELSYQLLYKIRELQVLQGGINQNHITLLT